MCCYSPALPFPLPQAVLLTASAWGGAGEEDAEVAGLGASGGAREPRESARWVEEDRGRERGRAASGFWGDLGREAERRMSGWMRMCAFLFF